MEAFTPMQQLLADDAGSVSTFGTARTNPTTQSGSAGEWIVVADKHVTRLMEITASSLLLLLLSPLFLLIAICIKLDSRGSVLFVQDRIGLNGRTFRMFKFRSMVVDAEERKESLLRNNERSGPAFKMRRDPRVTKVGAFLRRYSIDEVPQLLNVIKGDMSLIGPRPALPQEVVQYSEVHKRRLIVKPGLTGLWQVSGRANLSFEESIELDLYYVEHRSLALDMRILLKTASAVLSGEGAY
jgi:exopolysaccharide biosynthesis polyprenyl glycosylphosphotransferase